MPRHGSSSSASGTSSNASHRSSSQSSTSSKNSRISEVSCINADSDKWRMKFLQYAAGANTRKPLVLKKTTIENFDDDGTYEDDESLMSECSSYTYELAWVSPRSSGSFPERRPKKNSHSEYKSRRPSHTRSIPPSTQHRPPPRPFPPGPAPFQQPGVHPMPNMDEFDDFNEVDEMAGMGFDDGFYNDPSPPVMGVQTGFVDLNAGSTGASTGFFNVTGRGCSQGQQGKPGKYDDWAE